VDDCRDRPIPGGQTFRPGSGDRRHEAVAASGNVRQIPAPRLTIAERPAQTGDMNPQCIFVDQSGGPDACLEFVLADEFTRIFDKHLEDIEGTAAEANGRFAFQQQLLCRKEAERAE